MNILEYILSFAVFAVLQSCFILGLFFCFSGTAVKDNFHGTQYTGNVFYMLAPKFFEKHRFDWWASCVFKCYKCMSSLYGTITFWTAIALFIPFNWRLIFVWLFDVAILIPVSSWINKRT